MTPLDSARLLADLEENPNNVSFSDLEKLCEQYFGHPRKNGSHQIYRTPWAGDPRINIQNKNGKAKPYQVKQVVAAIRKLQTTR